MQLAQEMTVNKKTIERPDHSGVYQADADRRDKAMGIQDRNSRAQIQILQRPRAGTQSWGSRNDQSEHQINSPGRPSGNIANQGAQDNSYYIVGVAQPN